LRPDVERLASAGGREDAHDRVVARQAVRHVRRDDGDVVDRWQSVQIGRRVLEQRFSGSMHQELHSIRGIEGCIRGRPS
jgi:hypothetical protein